MILPSSVLSFLSETVGVVVAAAGQGGGDTSRAARVDTPAGRVFVKWGPAPSGLTYAAEAEGLDALARAAPSELLVPTPLAHREPDAAGPGVLVLPWIEPGRPDDASWRRFGHALADLHRAAVPGGAFGAHADNWIGSKPQRNGWDARWPTFFGARRLLAQAKTVRAVGAWDARWDAPFARLVERLPDLVPEAPPRSLVHGDLWAGNALAITDGRFALVDPAVYVGHREVDLAMTELFGGFPPAFADGYRRAWPLEPGYAERREIYNLFHLVNHLTHGPQYRAPVEATLRRFGS